MKWLFLPSVAAVLLRRGSEVVSVDTAYSAVSPKPAEKKVTLCSVMDMEFCPSDKSCKPARNCSSCVGFSRSDALSRSCQSGKCKKPLLPFIAHMCGEEPSDGCCTFALGLIACHDWCAGNIWRTKETFGACATTVRSCPLPICENICGCIEPGVKCPDECWKPCQAYKKQLYGGSLSTAVSQVDFVKAYKECVFGEKPKDRWKPALCA